MLSWMQQIDAAKSPFEVVAVARDYLASWTPDELSRLPTACRPGRVKDEQDIDELHVCLVEEYARNRLAGDALAALQKMTSFIVRASVRVAELRSDDDGPVDHDDDPPPAEGRRSAAARDR
jgi:hypothetical protein